MPDYIDVVKPISDRPDDLFICATGVEGTCMVVPKSMGPGYDAQHALILRYQNPERGSCGDWFNSWQASRVEDISLLLANSLLSEERVEEVAFIRGLPGPNYRNLDKALKDTGCLEGVVRNVTIDMTSILDEDLVSLLHYLDKPGNNLKLLYAEPPKGKLPMNRGILNQGTVHGFDGDHQSDGTYHHVCAFLCGYEPGKIYALDDHIRARDSVLFFPKPSFHKNWDSLSKRVNRWAVGGVHPIDSKDVSGLDPIPVMNGLQELYNAYPINDEDREKRWYMGVAMAGGTKWQTVGAYLFLRDKVEREPGYDWSHVALYFCTSAVPPLLGYHGSKISEFMLPKAEEKPAASPAK